MASFDVERSGPDLVAVAAIAIFVYFVIVSGVTWSDASPSEQVATAVLATIVGGIYVWRAPTYGDALDRRILVALLLFLVACVLSRFPRESFRSALTVFVLAAGLYTARGVLSRQPARRLLLVAMMFLSALLTVVFTLQVLLPFTEWWARTGWQVFPPLDLKSLPQPWGLRYEPLVLLLMLYPAWWVGHPSKMRTAGGLGVGVMLLIAAVVVGSRTVWFAMFCASAAVGIAAAIRHGWRPSRRTGNRLLVAGAAASALVVVLLGGVLLERVTRVAPLTERGATWSSSFSLWSERPLFGQGPGSFPWLLQLTDYFATNSFTPRQADSSYIQLLVGAGIVGVAAFLVAAIGLAPAVWRGRSRGAVFAAVIFLVAGVGLGPTEFMPILVVGVGWMALAAPRHDKGPPASTHRRSLQRGVRIASAGAAGLVGVAYATTIAAGVAYSTGVQAIYRGDTAAAESLIGAAATFDPGLAIYVRQAGTVRLLAGDLGGAERDLERAVATNPADDLAWRILGIVRLSRGDLQDSTDAFEEAVKLQRSDPSNLLLYGKSRLAQGDVAGAESVFAEVVQAWPLISADPQWANFIDPLTPQELLESALARWDQSSPSPEPLSTQPLLLAMMTGADDAVVRQARARMDEDLRAAFVAVTRCDADAADMLAMAPASMWRLETYWRLEMRLDAFTGGNEVDALRIHRLMTGDDLYAGWNTPLNPLWARGSRGANSDTSGYRRISVAWPSTPWDLPSPRVGNALWYRQPEAAAETAGAYEISGNCQMQHRVGTP